VRLYATRTGDLLAQGQDLHDEVSTGPERGWQDTQEDEQETVPPGRVPAVGGSSKLEFGRLSCPIGLLRSA